MIMVFKQKVKRKTKILRPRPPISGTSSPEPKEPIKKMLEESDDFEGPGYGPAQDEEGGEDHLTETASDEDEDHEEAEVEEDHQEIRVRIKKKGRAERLELLDMRREFKDRVRVTFQTTNEPDGEFPIKAAINGHTFVIKREEQVDLPRCVLRMLDNAIYTKYREDRDRSKRGELVYKAYSTRRFPYTIVQDPAPAQRAR